jgi:hypothetical protein
VQVLSKSPWHLLFKEIGKNPKIHTDSQRTMNNSQQNLGKEKAVGLMEK